MEFIWVHCCVTYYYDFITAVKILQNPFGRNRIYIPKTWLCIEIRSNTVMKIISMQFLEIVRLGSSLE